MRLGRKGLAYSAAVCLMSLGVVAPNAVAHPASHALSTHLGSSSPTSSVTAAAHASPAQAGQGSGRHGHGHKPSEGAPKWFEVSCAYSHNGPQDPIVMPGMAGMSHNHEFFGNTTTDENSTTATLVSGSTTCNDPNDTSAYWVPTLYQDGARVEPREAHIRYSLGRAVAVTAFPAGFMAISGRSDTTAGWACLTPRHKPQFSGTVGTVPTCSAPAALMARIVFPQCWDGSSRDSVDHASHLAWAVKGVCPADHPVLVPQVRIDVVYPPEATGGSGVTLASGDASTLHADIFEVWQGSALQDRIVAAAQHGGPAHRPRPAPGAGGPHGPGNGGPGNGGPGNGGPGNGGAVR